MNKLEEEVQQKLELLKKIRSEQLNNSLIQEIDKTIAKVTAIGTNQEIKVAVMGEFSSGKSTFINTLVGAQILSVGDKPTTAITTYIRYCEENKCNIFYNNGKSIQTSIDKIENYTQEGKKISEIDKVEILYNFPYLQQGIILIDTPGTNVEYKKHNEQRDQALDIANIGIFLISVQTLTNQSFIDFLTENKEKMGKVIFVITKSDLLQENTVDVYKDKSYGQKASEIKEYVRQSIEAYGAVENPTIFMISTKHWEGGYQENKEIESIKQYLYQLYIKNKNELIEYEINRTLTAIYQKVQNILTNKQELCLNQIKQISGELEDFDKFCFDNYNQFIAELRQSRENMLLYLVEEIYIRKNKCRERIKERLDRIHTMRSYKANVQQSVEGAIKGEMVSVMYETQTRISKKGQELLRKAEAEYKNYFLKIRKTYEYLGIEEKIKFKEMLKSAFISFIIGNTYIFLNKLAIGMVEVSIATILSGITIMLLTFCINLTIIFQKKSYHVDLNVVATQLENLTISTKNNDNESSETVSVGVGTVIGAIAGGPLGALVGAGLGEFFGRMISSERLEALKKECMLDIEKEMDRIEKEIIKTMERYFDSRKVQIEKEYKNYIFANNELYESLIEGINTYNSMKLVQLKSNKNRIKQYLKEIEKLGLGSLSNTTKSTVIEY